MLKFEAKLLSILICCTKTVVGIERKNAPEQVIKDSKKTHSLIEALRLETGDYHTLANNYYKVKLNILMLSGLLVVHIEGSMIILAHICH